MTIVQSEETLIIECFLKEAKVAGYLYSVVEESRVLKPHPRTPWDIVNKERARVPVTFEFLEKLHKYGIWRHGERLFARDAVELLTGKKN